MEFAGVAQAAPKWASARARRAGIWSAGDDFYADAHILGEGLDQVVLETGRFPPSSVGIKVSGPGAMTHDQIPLRWRRKR